MHTSHRDSWLVFDFFDGEGVAIHPTLSVIVVEYVAEAVIDSSSPMIRLNSLGRQTLIEYTSRYDSATSAVLNS